MITTLRPTNQIPTSKLTNHILQWRVKRSILKVHRTHIIAKELARLSRVSVAFACSVPLQLQKNRTSAIATFPVPVKEKRFVTLFFDFPALENSRANYMREKQHVRTTGLENMELKADREGVKQRVTETAVFTKLHFSLDIHPYNWSVFIVCEPNRLSSAPLKGIVNRNRLGKCLRTMSVLSNKHCNNPHKLVESKPSSVPRSTGFCLEKQLQQRRRCFSMFPQHNHKIPL